MAKRLSVLRRFTVSTVQYDGWMELEHHWRECDWTGDVVDGSLPAIMRMATAHAKVCDGKPRPRPEPREPLSSAGFMPAIWSGVIVRALERGLSFTAPISPGNLDALFPDGIPEASRGLSGHQAAGRQACHLVELHRLVGRCGLHRR